ncbi:MAG: LysM peptidoglycan-binding domain-containing protein [Aristaeellaceae bacterium]
MAYDRNKVIAIALAEVGYLEKASNAQLDDKTANAGNKNYTKYARDMKAVTGFYNGGKQGVAWCDVFVDWCFVKAYGAEAGRKLLCQPMKSAGAGVKWSASYYKAKGQYFTDVPHEGDQIFFGKNGSYTHTGLVYQVANGKVYTVEGNTSAGKDVIPNGGAVCKKSYSLSNSRIMGYGRPAYGDSQTAQAPAASDTDNGTKYIVKQGDTLWGLSQKFLGKGNRYREIMKANGMKNTILRPGMALVIPSDDKA